MFLAGFVPSIADVNPVAGRAAAYVCRNFSCEPPVTDAQKLEL
jgi:uncharacterized protein YyaL (SSP411 family)